MFFKSMIFKVSMIILGVSMIITSIIILCLNIEPMSKKYKYRICYYQGMSHIQDYSVGEIHIYLNGNIKYKSALNPEYDSILIQGKYEIEKFK